MSGIKLLLFAICTSGQCFKDFAQQESFPIFLPNLLELSLGFCPILMFQPLYDIGCISNLISFPHFPKRVLDKVILDLFSAN